MVNRRKMLAGKVLVVTLGAAAFRLASKSICNWFKRISCAGAEGVNKKRPYLASATPEQSKRQRQSEEGLKRQAGSIVATTALLAAKISVPASDQDNPGALGEHYDRMAVQFKVAGLNISAVQDSRKYFRCIGNLVEPLEYASFATPLARGAVRLGVFRLGGMHADELTTAIHQAAQEILAALPTGWVVHYNDRQHYHLTVQMISHPSDPRPNALVMGGGIDLSNLPSVIPAPSPSAMRQEQQIYMATAASSRAPVLEVHSLVFANSGSLLLLFTDCTGIVYALRQQLKKILLGSPEKQPTILHATLARVLTAKQMSTEVRAGIVARCKEWTLNLKGKQLIPQALWHVQENTFTHVNEDESSLECPFLVPTEFAEASSATDVPYL